MTIPTLSPAGLPSEQPKKKLHVKAREAFVTWLCYRLSGKIEWVVGLFGLLWYMDTWERNDLPSVFTWDYLKTGPAHEVWWFGLHFIIEREEMVSCSCA